MPPRYDPQYDIYREVKDPSEQWIRDRGIIASWLNRQAEGGMGERRLDGTSNAVMNDAELGTIAIHDYWSFCRPDFNPAARQQSYLEILNRQQPILSFDFTRSGGGPEQLVIFLNGEMDTSQGYAESFARFTSGQPAGALVAVNSRADTTSQTMVDLYGDEFCRRLLVAIRRGILHSSGNAGSDLTVASPPRGS